MLITAEHSCLLVVDVQEKLINAVCEPQRVIDNTAWLLRIAARLDVPILASEQYPRGLGHTVAALQPLLPAGSIMEKAHFSCTAAPACRARIEDCGRRQFIIAGIEAHVCVLQTALGLLEMGQEAYVVADAIASRAPANAELAVARMRAEGVRIVSREMVAFEWLNQAGTEIFREISRDFLR